MKYNPNYDRFLYDEQQRLLREVSNQRMSWRILGKIIQLNAIVRMRGR